MAMFGPYSNIRVIRSFYAESAVASSLLFHSMHHLDSIFQVAISNDAGDLYHSIFLQVETCKDISSGFVV